MRWLALFLLVPGLALANPPGLSHHGRLLDATDQPVGGVVGMTFTLWDAPTGGTAVWSESWSVTVVNGYYAVLLGDPEEGGDPIPPALFGQQLHLGITVGDGPELQPRTALGASAYALRAAVADSVVGGALDGVSITGATIDANSLKIGGTPLFDENGQWAAPPGMVPFVTGAEAVLRTGAQEIDGTLTVQRLVVTDPSEPPLEVTSDALVLNLNAEYVGGRSVDDLVDVAAFAESGFLNLALNGSFEQPATGQPPSAWDAPNGGATVEQGGRYGARALRLSDPGDGSAAARQVILGASEIASRSGTRFTAAVQARRVDGSAAARLCLVDGAGAVQQTCATLTDGAEWTVLSVTHTVSATPLSLEVRLSLDASGAPSSWELDGVVLAEGPLARAFSPHVSELIGDGGIQAGQLSDGSVTTAKLADAAVTSAKIAGGAVGTAQLADDAVGPSKLGESAVQARAIADGAVETAKLASGAVDETRLAPGAVTETRLADSAVTTDKLGDGAVIPSKLALGAVTAPALAEGAVTTDSIGTGAVTFDKLAPGAVAGAALEDGSVTREKIAFDAVDSDRLAPGAVSSSHIAPSAVGSTALAIGAVLTDRIADGAVSSGKLADGAVGVVQLADGAVTEAKLGSGAVTSTRIADGAVGTAALADGGVTSLKLASSAVTETRLASGAVSTGKLQDKAVTEAKLGDGAVSSLKLAEGAVNESALGTGAVTQTKLGPGAVTSTALADNAVIEAKLGLGAVTSARLADNAVIESKLGPQAVTETKIASNAVITDKLATGAVETTKIADNAVTTPKLGSKAVTGDKLDDLSVSTGKLANDAVTTVKIADFQITTNKLGDKQVTGAKIADNTISGNKLVNSAVGNAQLADDAVTDAKVLAGSLTGSRLALGTVTGDRIADATIPASKLIDGAGSGVDADWLDGLNSTSFLRSDVATTASSSLTVNGALTVNNDATVNGILTATVFDGAYTPRSQSWGSQGTGASGAAIYNDTASYKALMIVGNDSELGGTDNRKVRVYDHLWVYKDVTLNGNLIIDNPGAAIFTGTASTEQNRYLNVLNSPNSMSASGIKAGGLLVSDNFGYANPGKNDLVVKGRITAGGPIKSYCAERLARYEAACIARATAAGWGQVATVSAANYYGYQAAVTGASLCANYVGNNNVTGWSCLAMPYVYDTWHSGGNDIRLVWGSCWDVFPWGGYNWFDKEQCSGVMMACCGRGV